MTRRRWVIALATVVAGTVGMVLLGWAGLGWSVRF